MGSLNRTLYQKAQFASPGLEFLVGSFTITSGAGSAAEGYPFAVDGSDLTNSATGVLVLTVPGEGDLGLLAPFIQLEDTTKDIFCVVDAVSEANRTITLNIFDDAAAPADPTDGGKVNVLLVLKGRPL